MMFSSITIAERNDRALIEIPRPKLQLDRYGSPISRDGRLQFNVKAEGIDFQFTKNSPVKYCFYERYVVGAKCRVKPLDLAVFFYLVMTTEWSAVRVLVDADGAPVLTAEGRGYAVIETYGNRSATRSVDQIAKVVGASYGAVQKALTFWEREGVMQRIPEYKKKGKGAALESGRPIEYRRYEFDPRYVWNGHVWVGNGWDHYLNGGSVIT